MLAKSLLFISIFAAFYYSLPVQARCIILNDSNLYLETDTSSGADSGFIIVGKIILEGNEKTKDFIIYRELDFKPGDTLLLSEMMAVFEKNEKQILTTALFNEVEINLSAWDGNDADVTIKVKERWYTFPIPIFEIADRNFNVWWVEKNRDLERIDYGIRFYQLNVRGRNEQLKIVANGGFTEKLELFYSVPYLNSAMNKGAQIAVSYSRNREIAVNTGADTLQFYEDKNFIRERFFAGLGLSHREGIHNYHFLDIYFHSNKIGKVVTDFNSNYFLNGALTQEYFTINYFYIRDYRDVLAYPLEGSLFVIDIMKTGVGLFNDLNIYTFESQYSKYLNFNDRFFLASRLKGKVSFPKEQPYFNQRGFGYLQDLVRGYEYYVIDGQKYILIKSSGRMRLLSYKIKSNKFEKLKKFKEIPIDIYFKLFFDAGYVEDKFLYLYNDVGNTLPNTFLYGYGAGVDLVTYYDLVFRLEYSLNGLNERGFFIHFKADLE
ncbi:MAG: BamA/TamA family outer membrane protein [Bacteroidetes bacterium]|nr:BamA/TamA family outer membrane protein [Bacteroidota bacterium]